MTKEQMFDWLVINSVSIQYYPLTRWEREDGSVFYSDFIMSAHGTQFAPAESLVQAIKEAQEILK